ncbi:MAG: hypothetical protein MZV49_14945 [Rhodopseudomonas palustris]|nr:hypothetical protein [Rhodopseudomonas palustris]
MVAEEFGQKLRPTNSGKPGTGPRFGFAKRRRQACRRRSAPRAFADIAQLDLRRAQLRDAQSQVAAEAQAIREKERAAFEGRARGAADRDQHRARRPQAVRRRPRASASRSCATGSIPS